MSIVSFAVLWQGWMPEVLLWHSVHDVVPDLPRPSVAVCLQSFLDLSSISGQSLRFTVTSASRHLAGALSVLCMLPSSAAPALWCFGAHLVPIWSAVSPCRALCLCLQIAVLHKAEDLKFYCT